MRTPSNLTLRQMRAFVEAYQLRNLTHAADALHMTQSAMSALIRQLEDSLGVQLFERTPRTLRPTRAADEAYAQVEGILERVATLRQDMRGRAEYVEQVLAFSCAPALASAVVPAVLASYKKQFPTVRTVMYDAADESLIQRVLTEDVEFSIGFFQPEPEGVVATALLVDHLCIVCPSKSSLAEKERVNWKDLEGTPIINLAKGVKFQQLISEALASAGRTYRPAYEISFIHTALAMVAQGLGLVVLPGYLAKGNPHVPGLVAKKLHDPAVERSLLVHTRQGHTLTSTATEFLEMLREQLLALS